MGNCSMSKNADAFSVLTLNSGFPRRSLFSFSILFTHFFSPFHRQVYAGYTQRNTQRWSLRRLGVRNTALRIVCIVDIITTCLIQHTRHIFIHIYCIYAYISSVWTLEVRCSQGTGHDALGSQPGTRPCIMSSREGTIQERLSRRSPAYACNLVRVSAFKKLLCLTEVVDYHKTCGIIMHECL